MNGQDFDAIVIGSGFGGSVMAHRLSEAGRSVCVLERGRPYPPGSFARTPVDFSNNFWDPSAGFHGLYDIWSFQKGMSAVVSSGLGGGSLIYANVLIRKDPKWFRQVDSKTGASWDWPVTRAMLDPHYDHVEKVMKPQKYPLDFPPYNSTPKTMAFKASAEKLMAANRQVQWYLPNLAVTFYNEGAAPIPGELIREDYPNYHNRQRSTCRLCGECDVGCNFGSKNTLDYNYLSLAKNRGADIRTLCEVRSFRPHPDGGYEVAYVQHAYDKASEGVPRDTKTLPLFRIRSRKLILAAGTLGSTYLLLKNRDAFPDLSKALGTKFSGNGDYLGIALKCQQQTNGATVPKYVDASYGPVITSTIRVDDQEDGGSGPGLYMQDAGFPTFLGWALEAGRTPNVLHRVLQYLTNRLVSWFTANPKSEIPGEVRKLLGKAEVASASMPLLGMGRDQPAGRFWLTSSNNQRFLEADFPLKDSQAYLQRVVEIARSMAEGLGGEFRQDPVTEFLNRLITVHPLGGCPMAANKEEGVVDPFSQVYGYPGFCIADGAVLPGPVGPNPSLTIAAQADRGAERLLDSW